MRTLLALLIAATCGAADVDFAIVPESFQFAGQVEYVLANAKHPFVDEDRRRALLGLRLQAHGSLAILGFAGATIDSAVADSGEPLQPSLPQDAATLADHARREDPAVTLLSVGLPTVKAPYRGLKELHGSVEIAYAVAAPKTWEIPFAKLKADEALIDGREGFEIAVVDDGDANRLAVRLSPEARLAVLDLEFRDAAGKAIAVRPPRSDRREAKPGKRRRQPASGRDDVLVYNARIPEGATVAVRYYAEIERRRVPITLSELAFGVTIPDAASVHASSQRGADDL